MKPIWWQIVVLMRSASLSVPELRRAAICIHEGKREQTVKQLNEALAILNEVSSRIVSVKNQIEEEINKNV